MLDVLGVSGRLLGPLGDVLLGAVLGRLGVSWSVLGRPGGDLALKNLSGAKRKLV